jgi:hypothetical protein
MYYTINKIKFQDILIKNIEKRFIFLFFGGYSMHQRCISLDLAVVFDHL